MMFRYEILFLLGIIFLFFTFEPAPVLALKPGLAKTPAKPSGPVPPAKPGPPAGAPPRPGKRPGPNPKLPFKPRPGPLSHERLHKLYTILKILRR
uniref:Uncharacterized protein n=1 Tax=Rhipicephalus appendiculatus TaxID=34631 RepID=A0A131YD92_RHIAP